VTIRAALYLRVSLDRSGEGLAVDRQRDACLRLVAYKQWEAIAEYVDNGVSATKKRPRPEYERMKDDAAAGHFDVVVVYKVDRLTRRPIEIEDWITLNEKVGVNVATVEGDLDLSTATGQQVAGILASIARGEMKNKSDRQKDAHVQRAASGKPWLTRRPFGFEPDGIEHRLAEAKVIRGMYADLLAGVSQSAIARDLNARGLTTTLGNPWQQTGVRMLLLNPRNAGLRAHKGSIVGKGSWKPIVNENTYRAARAILTTGMHPGGGAAKYLLSGVAKCGVCESSMRTAYTARGVRMYACSDGKHVSRNAESVELYVTEFVLRVLSRPDARDLMRDDRAPDVAELTLEVEALKRRSDDLAVQFADGAITGSQLAEASKRINANLAEAQTAMANRSRESVLGPLLGAQDVRRKWESLTVDRRREVVRTLVQVIVNPTRKGSKFTPEDVELRPVT
jgi:site-specific DNA recombinase